MPTFVLAHEHEAHECVVVAASWRGFRSALRGGSPLGSCATGDHRMSWTVQAADRVGALAQLPPYVAERTAADEVREVRIATGRLEPARLPDHIGALYRAAFAMRGSPHDAEDLVQETSCATSGRTSTDRHCPEHTPASRRSPSPRVQSSKLYALKARLQRRHPNCQVCGVAKATDLHHIKAVADRPDLALEEANALMCCHFCHALAKGKGATLRELRAMRLITRR
jgi:hypothetical protein